MIHFLLSGARKKENKDPETPFSLGGKSWWVMHPSNDAILAYCDTEEEADAVISRLKNCDYPHPPRWKPTPEDPDGGFIDDDMGCRDED